MKKYSFYYSIGLLFAFFGLTVFSYMHGLSLLPYGMMGILLLLMLSNFKLPISRISPFAILFVYEIFLIAVSFYNHDSIKGGIMMVVRFLVLTITVQFVINQNFMAFLKATYRFSQIYFVLNTVSCFLFRNGLVNDSSLRYPVYFLGTRNSMGSIIITLMVLNILYSHLLYGKINKKILILNMVGAIAPIYLLSATSIIGIFFVIIFELIDNVAWIQKLINKLKMIHIYFVGIALFLIFEILRLQEIFSFIIQGIFHKTITMSARTYIWDKSIELIRQKSILGYGIYDNSILDVKYFIPDNTHSFFFEVMMTGGIIGLFLVSFIFIILSNEKRIKSEFIKPYYWIKCYMLIIMIMGTSEATNLYYGFFVFIVIAGYMLMPKHNRNLVIRKSLMRI